MHTVVLRSCCWAVLRPLVVAHFRRHASWRDLRLPRSAEFWVRRSRHATGDREAIHVDENVPLTTGHLLFSPRSIPGPPTLYGIRAWWTSSTGYVADLERTHNITEIDGHLGMQEKDRFSSPFMWKTSRLFCTLQPKHHVP